MPGFGGTQRMPRLIGEGRAKELTYTAGTIKADEAYRIGLVNHIYPAADLMDQAKKMAQKIARQAAKAVGYSKFAINKGMQVDLDTGMSMESSMFGMCFSVADQKEGMNAFLNKRKPVFTAK
jgi:enoyl-CoA hydratase